MRKKLVSSMLASIILSVMLTANVPAAELVDEPAPEAVTESVEEPVAGTAEELPEEPVAEPVTESVEEPAGETAPESTEELSEEAAANLTEESVTELDTGATVTIVSGVTVYDYIYEKVRKFETDINIYSAGYRINSYDMRTVFDQAKKAHPDIFYAYSAGWRTTYDDEVTYVNVFSVYFNDNYKSEVAALDAVINDAMSSFETGMSDRDKAIVLHDYLVLKCEYVDAGSDNKYTAYGALVEGKAVCEGYACAYQLLCQKAGIPVCYVSSNYRNHDWNMVKLDGKWYQVDVTWDDPNTKSENEIYYFVRHLYMFLSEETMETDHVRMTKDWKVYYNGALVDYNANGNNKYESAFWKNVNSRMMYSGGYYYYPSSGSEIRRTPVGEIGGANSSSIVNQLSGNCSIEKKYGRLYFNTSNQIYSIKPDGTGKTLAYTLPSGTGGPIRGLLFEGDKLVCMVPGGKINTITVDGKPRVSTASLYVGTGNQLSLILEFENVPEGARAYRNDTTFYQVNKTTGDYSITIYRTAKDLVEKNKIELRDSNGKHIDLANSSAVNGICYYSVIDYANAIINDSSKPQKLVNLCKCIRDYATNANLYFNGKTATSHGTISDSVLKPYAPVITKGSVGQYYVGSSLVLIEQAVHIRHYFSKDLSNLTIEGGYWSKSKTNGIYFLQVESPIQPTDFGKMYECKVGDFKISYGVLSYVQRAKSKNANTNLIYLLEDMYRYSNAAKEYYNSL